MDLKKMKIEQKIYDVVTEAQFINTDRSFVTAPLAIERDGIVYPERKVNADGEHSVGVYDLGPLIVYVPPSEEERIFLSSEHIIDFGSGDIKNIIENSKRLQEQEKDILTTIDNVTKYHISENNEPEMVAIRTAVNLKGIDMLKYASRFKSNYNNDIRLLGKDKISISKLKSICSKLDIKPILVLEDMPGDIANPMGEKVVIELLTGEDSDE